MELNSTFDHINSLISSHNYTSLLIDSNLQYLIPVGESNIVLSVIDKSKNRFNAIVYYNSNTNSISPPIVTKQPQLHQALLSQSSQFINLPVDILHDIVIKMTLTDVLNLCQTNKYLNDNICNNVSFWKKKYVHDFVNRKNKTDEVDEDLINPKELQIDDINYWKEKYKNFGRVWSFGSNSSDKLGLGDIGKETKIYNPTLITSITIPIISISTGVSHSLLLDINGRVYSFGKNLYGQLGLGDDRYELKKNIPTLITSIITPIKAISAGPGHSLLLDVNGRVWSFGNNGLGQLGLGDRGMGTERNKPTLIPDITIPIKAISINSFHSLLLDINGRVWSFGNGGSGQLGLGDNISKYNPTLIANITIPIKSISTGQAYSLLLDINGGVWSFGSNIKGELGLGYGGQNTNKNIPTLITNIDIPIKAISTGRSHSLILDVNGRVWSFGWNNKGQLGLGDSGRDRYKPTLITNIPILIKSISAGVNHSLILDINNRVWSFGDDSEGQLGLGYIERDTNRDKPILITDITVPIKDISAGKSHSLLISY